MEFYVSQYFVFCSRRFLFFGFFFSYGGEKIHILIPAPSP